MSGVLSLFWSSVDLIGNQTEVEEVYREAAKTADGTPRAYLARFEEEDAAKRAAM